MWPKTWDTHDCFGHSFHLFIQQILLEYPVCIEVSNMHWGDVDDQNP